MLLFSQLNKIFVGCFHPEKTSLHNENKRFSGWHKRYFVYTKTTGGRELPSHKRGWTAEGSCFKAVFRTWLSDSRRCMMKMFARIIAVCSDVFFQRKKSFFGYFNSLDMHLQKKKNTNFRGELTKKSARSKALVMWTRICVFICTIGPPIIESPWAKNRCLQGHSRLSTIRRWSNRKFQSTVDFL